MSADGSVNVDILTAHYYRAWTVKPHNQKCVSVIPFFFNPDPMSISEHTPSFYQRSLAFLNAKGEPSWLDSYRWFILDSWLNLLIPVAAVAHYLNWDAPLRFGFSFVAIIPLAKVRATWNQHS